MAEEAKELTEKEQEKQKEEKQEDDNEQDTLSAEPTKRERKRE